MLHQPIEIPPGTRLAQFARMLDAFERNDVETAVDMLIERLDREDGNPDDEPDGDLLDGNCSEDDFMMHSLPDGAPGCPIADPGGGAVDDEGEGIDEREPEEHCGGIDAEQIDPAARRRHRDRIRATACDVTVFRNSLNGFPRREYRMRDGSRIAGWRL